MSEFNYLLLFELNRYCSCHLATGQSSSGRDLRIGRTLFFKIDTIEQKLPLKIELSDFRLSAEVCSGQLSHHNLSCAVDNYDGNFKFSFFFVISAKI